MPTASVDGPPEEVRGSLDPLHDPLLRAAVLGDYVRADRVAEARGRLRRGEHPADDELARAIVADATG